MNSGKINPAMLIAGMETMVPYNNVLPMSALNITAMVLGPGCGGKKPCVTESALVNAMPK